MATEFITTMKASGGDWTSGATMESTLQDDYTVGIWTVISISAVSSPPPVAGDAVTGADSGATGTIKLINAAETQVLLEAVTGTFNTVEVVEKDGDTGKNFTTSSAQDNAPILVVEHDDYEMTVGCTQNGWTTNATTFLRWRAAAGAQHDGTPGTGARCVPSSGTCFYMLEDYTELIGLACSQLSGNSGFRNSGTGALIENCLNYKNAGIVNSFIGNATTGKAINCTAMNITTTAGPYAFRPFNEMYHCTCHHDRGCRDIGTATNNCFPYNASQPYAFFGVTTQSYNISYSTGSNSASGTGSHTGVNSTVSATPGTPPQTDWVGFVSLTADSEDFHLIDFTDGETNVAIDGGTAITGIDEDFEGISHDASPDIGWSEFVAAAGGGGITAGSLSLTGVGI